MHDLSPASVRHISRRRANDSDMYSIASSIPNIQPYVSQQLDDEPPNSRHLSRGASRLTMSSTRSRATHSPNIIARRPVRYKRNVSFRHNARRASGSDQLNLRSQGRKSRSQTLKERYHNDGLATSNRAVSDSPRTTERGSPVVDVSSPLRSRKHPKSANEGSALDVRVPNSNWTDDVRQISTELDKLCDTAFNSISLSSSTHGGYTNATERPISGRSYQSPATSFSIYEDPLPGSDGKPVSSTGKLPHAQAISDRPLPPPPPSREALDHQHAMSYTQRELQKTRDLLQKRNRASYMEPGYLDDVIAHLDRLMQPSVVRLHEEERRAVSTPDPSTGFPRKDTFEQIIQNGNIGFRSSSEPTQQHKSRQEKNSIRVVDDDDGYKPISPIKPLIIRKKSTGVRKSPDSSRGQYTPPKNTKATMEMPLRQPRVIDPDPAIPEFLQKSLAPIEEHDDYEAIENGHKPLSKKRSWFRRNRQMARKGSRDTDMGPPPPTISEHHQPLQDCQGVGCTNKKRVSGTSEESQTSETRHKKGRFFKNIFTAGRGGKENARRADGGDYELNDEESVTTVASPVQSRYPTHLRSKQGDAFTDVNKANPRPDSQKTSGATSSQMYTSENRSKQTRPSHQNWLARFLRIKPATHIICFQVSKLRARREIASILREWRRYGMSDIQVNKEIAMIWARVNAKNCE